MKVVEENTQIQIDPDLLNVIVLGPGYGESILIKSPASNWFVIDSFQSSKKNDPLNVLSKISSEKCECILLTHPHQDHTAGADRFIDHNPNVKVAISSQMLNTNVKSAISVDEVARLSAVDSALIRIKSHKNKQPQNVIDIFRKEKFQVSDITVEALHPDKNSIYTKTTSPNMLATPVIVNWNKCSLLFGSDLIVSGWKEIIKAYGSLNQMLLFKIPHHGSKNAQYKDCLSPIHKINIITPYNKSRGVPRFEKNEGVDFILGFGSETYLTALPFKASNRRNKNEFTLNEIIKLKTQKKLDEDILITELNTKSSDPLGWIHLKYKADGSLQQLECSSSSLKLKKQNITLTKKTKKEIDYITV